MPSLHNIPPIVAVAVVGSLIAYTAYRRSAKRMAQKRTAGDLRTELRAEQESLRASVEALPTQIDLAKRARTAAAQAAGNTAPEGLQQSLGEMDLDSAEVELLKSQLPAADFDYESISDLDVEIRLVEVLASSLRAGALAEKYRASNSVQETDRESLTDDAEALIREASQYSLSNSRSSIAESAV
jgi:predicted lipid-binding transport protein (Tim44 family)